MSSRSRYKVFLIEETKLLILGFSQGSVRVLWTFFVLIQYYDKITKWNNLHVKLSNSQLNKLKSGIKISTHVNLNLLSNSVGESNDEANFLPKLSLRNTQVSRIRKDFENDSSTNITFSKTQMSKMAQLGGFLGRSFGSLLKTVLLLIGNVLKASAQRYICHA